MSTAIDPAAVRPGRVRGRYFRENFSQGGFDLVQVVPELVTNADAAVTAAGRGHGRIVLAFGPPDPAFLANWRRELRRLRVPGFPVWRQEVRCTDDGEGVDAKIVERRLGALGVVPEQVVSVVSSGVVCATCGWRRAAAASRACGTVAPWSHGSSRRPATTPSPTSTSAMTPRPSGCVARSASMT